MSDVIMNGVWIINVNPADKPLNIAACTVIVILIFGVAALLASFIVGELDWQDILVTCLVAVTIGILFGTCAGVIYNQHLNPVTYDVMIGDNVSFNDFVEQYETSAKMGISTR